MISNATDTFVGYDSWKVTNERAYVKLISSYGYSEILNWLDEIVYASELNGSLEGFNAYLNTQRYGVEDTSELTKKEQAIADKMAKEKTWNTIYKDVLGNDEKLIKKLLTTLSEKESLDDFVAWYNVEKDKLQKNY